MVGERGERFRRVIGSAGVDAILSSIPHQPPPRNLYPPGVLSFSRAHAIPSATRDPLEIDTNTKQPFPSEIEIDESWSTIRAGPQMAFKDPLGMFTHFRLCSNDMFAI